jgi:hypothetical protein
MTDANLPFTVSPSVSRLILHIEENGPSWVEFVGWYQSEARYEVIRVSFEGLIEVRSGANLGIGEIVKSEWIQEAIQQQRTNYPMHSNLYDCIRHFYIGGHDIGFQFLAFGIQWETIRELPNW